MGKKRYPKYIADFLLKYYTSIGYKAQSEEDIQRVPTGCAIRETWSYSRFKKIPDKVANWFQKNTGMYLASKKYIEIKMEAYENTGILNEKRFYTIICPYSNQIEFVGFNYLDSPGISAVYYVNIKDRKVLWNSRGWQNSAKITSVKVKNKTKDFKDDHIYSIEQSKENLKRTLKEYQEAKERCRNVILKIKNSKIKSGG